MNGDCDGGEKTGIAVGSPLHMEDSPGESTPPHSPPGESTPPHSPPGGSTPPHSPPGRSTPPHTPQIGSSL